MLREYYASRYTGLACTFSFLIREHGIEKVHAIVLETARSYSIGPRIDPKQSDALSKLAIAIVSPSIKKAMESVPRAKKAWHKKSEARIKSFDHIVEIADSMNFKELALYSFLEVIDSPFTRISAARFTPSEPVAIIQSHLDKFFTRKDEDHLWHEFEKFVLSIFPSEIDRQIEFYDELITIIHPERQGKKNLKQNSPLSTLGLKLGSAHKVAEVAPKYENARALAPKLKLSIKEFESTSAAELDGGRLWEKARYEIEKCLPDSLGELISYEAITDIQNQVKQNTAKPAGDSSASDIKN